MRKAVPWIVAVAMVVVGACGPSRGWATWRGAR